MPDTRRSALRREQVQLLLVSVPVLIAAYFLVGVIGSFAERPYVVVLVLVPLGAAIVALGVPLVRERRVLLGGGFLPFFVAYCLFFSVAAATRVLEGRRAVLTGFEEQAPSNVFGLNRLGDWHYWFAPRAPAANELVVVLLPSFAGKTVDEARLAALGLVAQATRLKATAVAFDFLWIDASRVDGALCDRIKTAEQESVRVITGYSVRDVDGQLIREPMSPALERCMPADRQGTLVGLLEADGRVRMVPTSHRGEALLRSFSYRIASILAAGRALPGVGLTQFTAPAGLPAVVHGAPDARTESLLSGHVVVVGSDRPGDVYDTPYGKLPGVLIHALAAHSLATKYLITRLDVGWVMPLVFLLCYVLALVQSRGGGARVLWASTAVMAVAILTASALAMRALLWVDTSYPLLAVGGMSAFLTGGARLQRRRALVTPTPLGPDSTRGFDVFVSYSRQDQPTVMELAEALRDQCHVRVWIDAWELVPGRPWQEAIEGIIESVPAVVVLVGGSGIGPWELPEMRACLDQCVNRSMVVIPVLLPGAPAKPTLPLFLRAFTWVDLRNGIAPEGLDRLVWGITGVKVRSARNGEG